MQVGALGFVPISQGIGNSKAKQVNEGFGSILSELTNSASDRPENEKMHRDEKSLESKARPPLKEELQKLIQLLNRAEQPNLDITVMNPLSSNLDGDFSLLVEENLESLDLPAMISTLLTIVKKENGELGSTISLEEIEQFEAQLPEMSHEEAIVSFLQILSFVKIEQIDLPIDQNTIEQMKNFKLIEMLAAKDPMNNHRQLTEFIQKFTDKLQGLVKEMGQTNRKEYLSQVFTPLTKDVKEGQVLLQTKPRFVVSDSLWLEQHDGKNSIRTTQNHIQHNGESLTFQPQLLKQDGITLLQGQPSKPVTTEQLIQQFEAILSKSQFMNRPGNQKLFIKLYPEHLGALRVELIQKDATMIAKIITTNSATKELLDSQLQSLKQAFQSQNIQMERIDISNGANFQERLINKDPQQRQQEQQQSQQKQQQDENDQSFEYSFSEALLNVEV